MTVLMLVPTVFAVIGGFTPENGRYGHQRVKTISPTHPDQNATDSVPKADFAERDLNAQACAATNYTADILVLQCDNIRPLIGPARQLQMLICCRDGACRRTELSFLLRSLLTGR
ncbi:hypothetical protein FHT77_003338 [Rhizobium sp. BK181]|uniref:hypothetical protein n=1 Tax=Rhizobium sp. BK181 TaxID=2587072 RepID=UPI001612828B|nr:hypothetical protein [Rhizobium sp. BK181]MBB3317449.1 hypothetical protein [Rhizobium sp. BK181]